MIWYLWIIAAVILVILEIFTPSLFFFTCLALGALFAGLASLLEIGFWWQVLVFAAASILSVFFIKPILNKFFVTKKERGSNIDEIIGKDAIVTEKIVPKAQGFVKILGEVWVALADEEIEKGSTVTIVSVSGTKLNVKKK